MPLRARKEEDKSTRRATILAAARGLFGKQPYAAISMDQVAGAAGLAKGTLYLYFDTREQLFLALLEDLLAEWFLALETALGSSRRRLTPAQFAALLWETLAARPLLVRLLALMESVLERNISAESAALFKTMLRDRMSSAGALLEQRLTGLAPGDGLRVLLHLRALLTGLTQMADPSPVLREVLAQRPDLAVFQLDLGREFTFAATALVEGWPRHRRQE